MTIQTVAEYVRFFVELNMGDQVTLLGFAHNEKRILKLKLKNKEIKKEQVLKGIQVLEELIQEIKENEEKPVIEKYLNT